MRMLDKRPYVRIRVLVLATRQTAYGGSMFSVVPERPHDLTRARTLRLR